MCAAAHRAVAPGFLRLLSKSLLDSVLGHWDWAGNIYSIGNWRLIGHWLACMGLMADRIGIGITFFFVIAALYVPIGFEIGCREGTGRKREEIIAP